MTAVELIHLLQALPPDTRLVVRGYEDGYNDITVLKPLRLQPREGGAEWYYGEYETGEQGFVAMELFGENKNPKDDL